MNGRVAKPPGERSTIPKDLAEILDRMNIEEEAWLDTVQGYDDLFGHVVDSCASMGEADGDVQNEGYRGQPPRVQVTNVRRFAVRSRGDVTVH